MQPSQLLLFLAFCLNPGLLDAQLAQESPTGIEPSKDNKFYFYWGYNRGFYSKTNLHFNGPNYDFTVYDLTGQDRPFDFGLVYVNPATFTIPQYNVRLGYFINDRVSVSLGMDHMKYIVDQNQPTRISGVISEEASGPYAGSYLNQPIDLKADLLIFEHTNGFNLASLEVEYLQPLFSWWNNRIAARWSLGAGGVWVVTKTDVRVFGDGLDNDFHVAGYTLAGKTGPRLEFWNKVFIAGELKTGYASLPAVLIKNDAPEIGDHNLLYYEYYFVAGVYFDLRFRKK
jgi:hypothetical protein